MSVRDAVAKREEQAVELAKKPSLKATAEERLRGALPTLQDVLPRDFDPARWTQVVLVAIKANVDLLGCLGTKEGTESLLLACIQAAELGLEPNTPLGDAWLQPRKNRGRQEAELSISYRGLAKLAMRHPEVTQVIAEVVREGDHFVYERSLLADTLEWKPAPSGKRGKPTHAFAVLRLRGGQAAEFAVLDEDDVHRARESSASWKGGGQTPWKSHEAAMWQKTAIRRLCTSTAYRTVEMARAVDVDERRLALDGEQIIAIEEAPEPALVSVQQARFLSEAERASEAVTLATGDVEDAKAHVADAARRLDEMAANMPSYDDEPIEVEVVDQPQADPETGELFAPSGPPWENWGRDEWAAWGRQENVQIDRDVEKHTKVQTWNDVARANPDMKARVYALGVPDGEPFE